MITEKTQARATRIERTHKTKRNYIKDHGRLVCFKVKYLGIVEFKYGEVPSMAKMYGGHESRGMVCIFVE